MAQYKIVNKIKYIGIFSIILSIIIIICGFISVIITGYGLLNALNNFQIINEITNPIAFEKILSILLSGNLFIYSILFLAALFFIFLPSFIYGIYLFVFYILLLNISKIITTQNAIIWKYPGGELITNWDNLREIISEKKLLGILPKVDYLVLKNPLLPRSTTRYSLFGVRAIEKIPLSLFMENWNSVIGKEIIEKAPWLVKSC
jgi:hypothetical protein